MKTCLQIRFPCIMSFSMGRSYVKQPGKLYHPYCLTWHTVKLAETTLFLEADAARKS